MLKENLPRAYDYKMPWDGNRLVNHAQICNVLITSGVSLAGLTKENDFIEE